LRRWLPLKSVSVTGRTAKHWRRIDDIKTPEAISVGAGDSRGRATRG
jgi:hypothetical protein